MTEDVPKEPQLNRKYRFDVTLSFAGAQREFAEGLNKALKERGVQVFYDFDYRAELWGEDLATDLTELYRKQAQYCVMLISREYRDRMWPTHERKAAFCAAMERREAYVLPVRFDETDIPGLLPSIAVEYAKDHTPESLAELVTKKLSQAPANRKAAEAPPAAVHRDLEAIRADLFSEIPLNRKRAIEEIRSNLTAGNPLAHSLCGTIAQLSIADGRRDDERAGLIDLLIRARFGECSESFVHWLLKWDPKYDIGPDTSGALGRYFAETPGAMLRLLAILSGWTDKLRLLASYRAWVLLTAFDLFVSWTSRLDTSVAQSMGIVCRELEKQHHDDSIRQRARVMGYGLRDDPK